MHRINRIIISALTTAGLYLHSAGGLYGTLCRELTEKPGVDRMKNVEVSTWQQPRALPAAALASGAAEEESAPRAAPRALGAAGLPQMEIFTAPDREPEAAAEPDEVLETTIEGGLRVKNETGYWVDASGILAEGPGLRLPADEPQILIIHTHASEAYTQAGLDRYAASDSNRTEDTQFNIVRIGDELSEILSAAGLQVIHDRGIYDFPSYTGSYTRSGEAIAQYLESCPGIRVVLDIHRDALGADGVVYKTMAEEQGVVASQVMLLVGTDESGLEHPGWRQNLAMALYLQNAVNTVCPTLMRPVDLVPQRYNQHLAPGSMIVEVGSSGNTLQEALAAIRLFGNAVAPALMALTEQPESE